MQQKQQMTQKQYRKLFEDRIKNEAGFEEKWLRRNRDKYFYPVIQTRWEDWLYVYSLNILEDKSDD